MHEAMQLKIIFVLGMLVFFGISECVVVLFGVVLHSTIFKLAVLDYFAGLKLAFVVTKFPQKVRVTGITNWSLCVYMPARSEYNPLLVSFH